MIWDIQTGHRRLRPAPEPKERRSSDLTKPKALICLDKSRNDLGTFRNRNQMKDVHLENPFGFLICKLQAPAPKPVEKPVAESPIAIDEERVGAPGYKFSLRGRRGNQPYKLF